MILETIFNLLFGLINSILIIIPSLPDFDTNMLSDFHTALDTIFDNADLLGFFFPVDFVKNLIPWVILVINFEHLWHFLIWVVTWIKSHK